MSYRMWDVIKAYQQLSDFEDATKAVSHLLSEFKDTVSTFTESNNSCPGNVLCDVCRQRVGGEGVNLPSFISRVLEHIARKFQRLPLTLFSSGTADVIGHRCVLEIQDGSQITGSTYISESMKGTIKIPTKNLRLKTL